MWFVAFLLAGLVLCLLSWKHDTDNRTARGERTIFDVLARVLPDIGGALVKLWRSLFK